MAIETCILCNSPAITPFYKDTSKHYASNYYQCRQCRLIFAPPKDRPSPEAEFARYETHENDPEDEGYRNFLRQLFDPLSSQLKSNSKGLDFGSGPGPTLHIMFEEKDHEMNLYDPFYADNPEIFQEDYDFITATEVVEHLHAPRQEFQRLWGCLRPGGYLGIMTKLAKDDRQFFADWHYRLDLTHVTFYTRETFKWLASQWNATATFHGNRVIIFQKLTDETAK